MFGGSSSTMVAKNMDHFVHLLDHSTKDDRIDPRAEDNEAIRAASENGHDKVVKLLLDHKRNPVDPTAKNNEAIKAASENESDKVVKLLLKVTLNPDESQKSAAGRESARIPVSCMFPWRARMGPYACGTR